MNLSFKIIKGLKSKNPLTFAKTVRKIRTFIKENRIDIIHTHHRYSELAALNAKNSAGLNSVKSVFTALSIVNKKYNIEYKSDRIIAVSNSVKNMLTGRFSVDKNKISLIPNFTDTAELQDSEKSGILSSEKKIFNLLGVGRFHKEKNFGILLKSLGILKDNSIRLILVGEGKDEKGYKKYIKKHDLNVKILTPQKELPPYFHLADLCVLPSLKDPFPNFMLQAGLHKKPFVGANVDGIGELIKDGENGLLFTSGNENELASKIIQFKNNPELAVTCAENLHNTVMKDYTQESIIPKIEKLYNDVMDH
jgi:glycosyltransferase involved in cell wall biosynthesis